MQRQDIIGRLLKPSIVLIRSILQESVKDQLTAFELGLGANSSTAPAASPTNAPVTAPYA